MKIIKVAVDAPLLLSPDQISFSQGSLKTMSKDSADRLAKTLEEDGQDFVSHVWKDQEGKFHLVDGHGRLELIQHKRQIGEWEVPEVPCVNTHAENLNEAKKKILRSSSTYHRITNDGLYQFMNDLGLSIEELKQFDLPDINLDDFKMEYFEPEAVAAPDGPSDQEKITVDEYNNRAIKSIHLFYPSEQFREIVSKLDSLCRSLEKPDHSALVALLIDEAISKNQVS